MEAFESASELREQHAQLLDALDRQLGEDPDVDAEAKALPQMQQAICAFLERGAATGVYLEEVRERTACQVLLDYWSSGLAQAALGSPPSRLAAFDGAKLPDLTDKPCPYVGLDAFRDRAFFFGRESDTQALVAQLRDTPLVVVLGASGSGKSSLVMGGVLPALRDADVQPRLRVAPPIVPGTTPLAHLSDAVLQISDTASGDEGEVKYEPGRLSAMLGGASAQATLITIDQFEEVFTLTEVAEREAVAASLLALLESRRGHRVILTMREEFRSRLVELRDLSRFLDKAWYSMRPMGYEELRATIERPAALVNLQFQSGIIDDLVKKVLGQPAALPLLQFTLRALWDRRDRNRITWEVYRRVGDPLTALKTSADDFYEALAPQTQAEARRILLELVRVDELLEAYRQPIPKQRLLRAGKANTEEVLGVLTRHDYVRVTPGRDGEDAVVEVKHESLIRNWPRLVSWIDEKRIERRQRIALTQAAHRWAQSGRPAEGLLTGWQLEEAKRQADLSGIEREFVVASADQLDRVQQQREQKLQDDLAQERRRARLNRLAALAVIAFLLSVTAFVLYLYREAGVAERVARLALGRASTQEAVRVLETKPGEALAHLARTLRADPDSLSATSLASDLLLNGRMWEARPPLALEATVVAAAFSPDGRRFVTAAADATYVWDTMTGARVGVLQHQGPVTALAYSRDGARLVTTSADLTARVWDASTGDLVGGTLNHMDVVNAAVFSPDGRNVITVSADTTARLWDATTGQPIGPALKHLGAVKAAAFSPNGKIVLTVSSDTTARVWDIRDVTKIRAAGVLAHNGAVNAVAFSPDGERVATASDDPTARLWTIKDRRPGAPADAIDPKQVGTLPHQRAVLAVAFSPDGRRVVTASADSTARLWDAYTLEPLGTPLQHQGAVSAVTFSADGRRVITASADGTVRIWSSDTGQPVADPLQPEANPLQPSAVTAVAGSADGWRFVTASAGHGARVWDAVPGSPAATPLPDRGRAVAAILGSSEPRLVIISRQETRSIWDAARGQWIGPRFDSANAVSSAAFSADGGLLITSSGDRKTRVWDANGNALGAVLEHGSSVGAVAISADGQRIATGSIDGIARVWNAVTGEPMGPSLEHRHNVAAVAFSRNGRRLLTASAAETRLWDANTGQPVDAPVSMGGAVVDAAFGSNGPLALSVLGNTARIWDGTTGQPVGVPLTHRDTVNTGDFSPDGRRVVTASADGTARVWDAATGQPIGAPLQHQAGVVAAVFSADGHYIVTTSAGDTVRVWQVLLDLDSESDVQLLADLAEVVGRHRVSELSSVVPLNDMERGQRLSRLAALPLGRSMALETVLRFLVRPR
jgi:WD40 repeat protein